MEPSVLQRMKGTAMNEKAFRRTGWLRIVLTLLCITIAGASVGLLTGCASDNTATVGKLTISYPDDLRIEREDANMSVELPEGMASETGSTLTNDDYSIAVNLIKVDDPGGRGIAAVEAYWREHASTPVSEEDIAALDAKMPGMREVIENTVIDEPETIELNGQHVVVATTTYKGVRTMTYYIEADGKIVGAVRGIFSTVLYENDPKYFDDIFSSICVV